jgi:hypothetical protein
LPLAGCPVAPPVVGASTTVIIVRHAERDPGLDPPLNEEGLARAQVLRDVLGEQGVTAIYCTDLVRNRQTVQPLADDLGLPLNTINPATYADTLSAANTIVNDILTNHAGGTVLFCGNIGSVFGTPGINETLYQRLGGTGRAPTRYQDFYVVVIPDEGAAHFIKAEYGGESSLDP